MSDGDDDGDGGSGCSSYSLKLHAPSGQEIDNEFGDDISMEDVSYDDHHDPMRSYEIYDDHMMII